MVAASRRSKVLELAVGGVATLGAVELHVLLGRQALEHTQVDKVTATNVDLEEVVGAGNNLRARRQLSGMNRKEMAGMREWLWLTTPRCHHENKTRA